MNTSKLITIIAAAAALTSCGKYVDEAQYAKEDKSKAKVTSLEYDQESSSETSVAFTFDASAAVAAGATSFTLYLADNLDSREVGNGATFKILSADQTSFVFKDLKPSAIYRPMIRANYDGYIYSSWTLINESQGISVGQGLVDLVFGKPEITLMTASDKEIALIWKAVPYAASYALEYKAANAEQWIIVNDIKATTYTMSGLTASTEYLIRLAAVKEKGETSEVTEATKSTLEPSKFDPKMKTAQQVLQFFVTEAKNAVAGDEFSLENDIDMTGVTLPSIEKFAGNLNGKGFTLKNLSLVAPMFLDLSGELKDIKFTGSLKLSVESGPETGLFIAAVAKNSTGKLNNVTSGIAVTIESSTVINFPNIGGLVAIQVGGEIKNCTNDGDIKLSHNGANQPSGDQYKVEGYYPFASVGGIVGNAFNMTIDGCKNNGNITVTTQDNSKVACRHYIGGIVGEVTNMEINNCENKGNVSADFSKTSAATAGKQVWIAGICGGRNGENKAYDGANITNCKNYGEITLANVDVTNYYLAGIAAQSQCEAGSGLTGPESYAKRLMKGCTNYGKLVKKGSGQVRCGSLSGGTVTASDCVNEGEIVVEEANAGSVIGGFVGYPTQAHVVKNCTQKGKITCKVDVACAVGGAFGQGGNTNQNHEGVIINCEIVAQPSNVAGMIVGTAKTLGSGKVINYGTSANPFKIKGKIKGVDITAGNMADYYTGDKLTTAGGTINVVAVYGE